MEIGPALKRIRLQKGLTLRELSSSTDLSIGFLSNLERDINNPTISSLSKVCQALGTNLVDFLQNPKQKQGLIVRKHERERYFYSKSSGITYELVSVDDKMLRAVCITIEPGGDYGKVPTGHEGEEFGLVLSGTLEITVEDETFTLNEGDSIYIDANVPHKYRNAGKSECVTLWVVQRKSITPVQLADKHP
ncbi:MAG: cupin domain-containing protein [Firmicutes bacterium]|nr:cupin domain-containing protein [Bacillota bacterium]